MTGNTTIETTHASHYYFDEHLHVMEQYNQLPGLPSSAQADVTAAHADSKS
jgi:hypothetical protein